MQLVPDAALRPTATKRSGSGEKFLEKETTPSATPMSRHASAVVAATKEAMALSLDAMSLVIAASTDSRDAPMRALPSGTKKVLSGPSAMAIGALAGLATRTS